MAEIRAGLGGLCDATSLLLVARYVTVLTGPCCTARTLTRCVCEPATLLAMRNTVPYCIAAVMYDYCTVLTHRNPQTSLQDAVIDSIQFLVDWRRSTRATTRMHVDHAGTDAQLARHALLCKLRDAATSNVLQKSNEEESFAYLSRPCAALSLFPSFPSTHRHSSSPVPPSPAIALNGNHPHSFTTTLLPAVA